MLFRLPVLLVLFLLPVLCLAQDLISAKAGFINFKSGQVTVPAGPDGNPARQLSEGQGVSTGFGRAEILLAPGSFFRLDHGSEARLISSKLTHAQVELVSGAASLEVNELPKKSLIEVFWRGHAVPVTRNGLYRFEAADDRLRLSVRSGKLKVAGGKTTVKSGRFVELSPEGVYSAAMKFNRKDQDDFDSWASTRSYSLAAASFSAANSLYNRRGYGFRSGLWYWLPGSSFFTYVPYRECLSPWGFSYYSPRTVWLYNPHPGWRRGRGTRGGGSSGVGGNSGGGSSTGGGSPSVTTPSPRPAPSLGGPSRSPKSQRPERPERGRQHFAPGAGGGANVVGGRSEGGGTSVRAPRPQPRAPSASAPRPRPDSSSSGPTRGPKSQRPQRPERPERVRQH